MEIYKCGAERGSFSFCAFCYQAVNISRALSSSQKSFPLFIDVGDERGGRNNEKKRSKRIGRERAGGLYFQVIWSCLWKSGHGQLV